MNNRTNEAINENRANNGPLLFVLSHETRLNTPHTGRRQHIGNGTANASVSAPCSLPTSRRPWANWAVAADGRRNMRQPPVSRPASRRLLLQLLARACPSVMKPSPGGIAVTCFSPSSAVLRQHIGVSNDASADEISRRFCSVRRLFFLRLLLMMVFSSSLDCDCDDCCAISSSFVNGLLKHYRIHAHETHKANRLQTGGESTKRTPLFCLNLAASELTA